jgi:O-antigen/teichoic acid export membrane protein
MTVRGVLPGHQRPAVLAAPELPGGRRLTARIASATAIPAAGQLAVQLTAAVTLAVAARRLDAGSFGAYVVATTVLGTAAALVDSGLTPLGVRESARHPERAAQTFRTVLVLRVALSLPLAVAAWLAFVVLVPAGRHGSVVAGVVLGAAVLVTGVGGTYRVPAQAQLRLGGVTFAEIVGRLATQGVLLAVVLTAAPDPHAALVTLPLAVGVSVTLACCFLFCRRIAPLRPWQLLPRGLWAAMARSAWPLGLAMVINQLYFRVDMLVVSATRSGVDVGAYGLAYRVLESANVFGGLFQAAVFPLLAAAVAAPARWRLLARRAVLVMGVAGLGLALSGLLLAGMAVRLLGGGNYPAAGPALSVLLVAGGLVGLLVITIDRQRQALWVNLAALALNASLCMALVPVWGILAAAWVGVGSELLMLAGNLAMLVRWAPREVAVGG